ncbi:MAG: MATE family efflux transporter [Draconibacterium sp.]|nr:MATE family efflux transporter [Draconibacterium sp.]
MAYPVVLSQVGQITVHLVDNMMVGHVGTTELAAASFANNVFMIGMYFGMGITYGLTPLIGKAFSKGKYQEVYILLKNGIFTHAAAAIFLTTLMFGVYFVLPFMKQPPEVLNMAKPYFLLLTLSYLPFMLFFSMKQFFEGIGNTKMAMQITLIANVINVAVNYVLIFGKLGFEEMGLIGAGIGTLVSRLLMPLLFVLYIIKIPKIKKYFVEANKQVFNFKKILSILKIGIPIGFQIIVEVTAFGIGAIMMGWLGEIPLAAHQVAIGLASFTYMISLGVSQANTIRVSHQIGVKDYNALKMAATASTHLVLAFMIIMGFVFVLARNYLPLLFTLDLDVIEIAAGLLIIAAIFQVFDGLQVIMLSTLRGMADVKLPMFFAFFAYLIIGIPTSYILTFIMNFGPQGIWFGYLVGLGVAGILFYFRFKYIFAKIIQKTGCHF